MNKDNNEFWGQRSMSNIYTIHHCSFCSKNSQEVEKLIEGRNNICICNECIEICVTIIATERRKESQKTTEDK